MILDKYLSYQCPDGYSFGSTCQLKCIGNFSLIGNDSIRCERNDSFTPPLGYWDMEDSQPYCLSKFPFDHRYFIKSILLILCICIYNVNKISFRYACTYCDLLAENPCDILPAPENGAMSCATWLFGMQCQMQCSSQYDIPYGTVGSNEAPFTRLFTCSESLGEYTPSNTVPGCTRM